MKKTNFAAGDVVWPKAGGYAMTVEAVDDSRISCIWFEGHELKRDIKERSALLK